MRKSTITAAAALALGGVVLTATPALAWDCIRASSSQQGLMNSTRSGNWQYATIQDLAQGAVDEGAITADQAACAVDAWLAAGEPAYFAIGAGVAGANGAMKSGHISDSDFFELAKNAPMKVMVNGKGVDHLDDALGMYAGACLGG